MAKKPIKRSNTVKKDIPGLSDYAAVVLERVEDKIGLLAENQLSLDKKIDDLGKDLGGRIDGLGYEMKSNFKAVFEYLSRAEDELAEIKVKLEGKVDRKEFDELKQQVLKIEIEFKEYKKLIAKKT